MLTGRGRRTYNTILWLLPLPIAIYILVEETRRAVKRMQSENLRSVTAPMTQKMLWSLSCSDGRWLVVYGGA